MSTSSAPNWVVPAMRVGYAARAAVYAIVGFLAITAAWSGGQAQGTGGALATLRDAPWGQALLWLVAVGLLAYAVWRLLAAAMDLEAYGSEAKGIFARLGLAVSGLIHGALAVQAASIAMGGRSGGSSSTSDWTAQLMSLPWGRWLVAIAGLIVIGAGIYYARKGWTEKYKEKMVNSRTTERLSGFCKWGLVAHGIVIGIIGGFLVYAGWTADPQEAGGIGAAFEAVRGVAFGRILLFLLGAGMIAFSIFCLVQARYRIVPRAQGDDVETLAQAAKSKGRRAKGKVASATS